MGLFIIARRSRKLCLELRVLALRRLDALRDLALASLSLGCALEVARGVGRRGDGRVQLDLELPAVRARVIERDALGASGDLVRVGEERLAEPAPLTRAIRLGQVALQRLDLAGELPGVAVESFAHGFAAFGDWIGCWLTRLRSVVLGHGGPR